MAEEQAIGIADLALLDDDFILALTESRERDIYAKIIALDANELPIDQIEGRVTGGSLSIDGDSIVRRTCNLTMIADEVEINDYYWGIKTKFSLEIGLKNNLADEKYKPGQDSIYPEIVWFKQGIFVITSFNSSLATNNYIITLTGKDKMCFLNGDLGGQLFASIDFGTEETKELIMLPVDILESSSEAILEGNTYYRQLPSSVSTVDISDKNFAFVRAKSNNANIIYFKKTQTQYLALGANETYTQQKYIGYQLISNPSQLFVQVQDFEKDKTYKRTEGDYYLLARSADDTGDDNNLYQLVQLYESSYEYSIVKIPLAKIIREAVHTYAQEPYHNILVNDLDDYGLEQLTFKGDAPLYALRDVNNDNMSYQLVTSIQIPGLVTLLDARADFVYDNKADGEESQGTSVYYNTTTDEWTLTKPTSYREYTISKYEYGDDIGYRITDLTYTGDLVSSIGDTLTTILDKIKTMLGNFEYFYDVSGRFIFQKKRTYVDTSWGQLTSYTEDTDAYVNASQKKFAFNFEDNRLITIMQNAPVLTNLRNDYTVWGKRTSLDGTDVPIHARYAIDVKPKIYHALNGRTFISNTTNLTEAGALYVDWRELIYQMALDYFAGQGCSSTSPIYNLSGNIVLSSPDNFLSTIGTLNPEYYPSGYTGYEQYYTDLQGFWRQLYDPFYEPSLVYDVGKYINQVETISNSKYFKKKRVWQDPQIIDCNFDYYVNNHSISTSEVSDNDIKASIDAKVLRYTISTSNQDEIGSRLYWNTQVFENPENLNFWFDFLDSGQELQQFSVATVGDRTKVVNEDRAQAIVFSEIPDVIIYNKEDYEDFATDDAIIQEIKKQRNLESGYTFICIPSGYSQFFNISYRSTSVKNKIDELLYNYSYCVENITLTTLPIYHLEPNTLIFVCNKNVGIEGEYIVKKLNIPLAYNGTMSITAVKAPQRLY